MPNRPKGELIFMIKKYEIMYIVDQDVNESDLKDITKKMDAILTAAGGKVVAHKA
jgi:ribosomal protein S6